MQLPNKFFSITNPNPATRPILLIGAGMSAGIVPMPPQLVQELASLQISMEISLGCTPAIKKIDPNKAASLYRWADEMITQLELVKKPEEAKKALAVVLGITSDARWRGRTKIPLRGNTPRHRVIARLAREGGWHALWSLNWDCILETALESVGMPAHPGGILQKKQPWIEWHRTWTQPENLPPGDNSILIIKPHGCAGKLTNNHCNTFKITTSELRSIGKNFEQHKAFLNSHFSLRPLLTCGWSASEGYLRTWLKQLAKDKALLSTPEALSIIDVKHNNRGHAVVIGRYGVKVDDAKVKVQFEQCYTTDELFLWVQTIFGLNHLKNLPNIPAIDIDLILESLQSPVCNYWINSWFDNFLPVWTRLCFNSGVTQFFVNAGALEAIPTDRRDEHIPWSYKDAARLDLEIATKLLLNLTINNIGESWDASRFPGGLWNEKTRHLVLPLPYLAQNQLPNLSALRTLADNHNWERKGDIMKLDILPLHNKDSVVLEDNFSEILRQAVGKLMKHSRLADYKNIGIVDFSALQGAKS